ncbi:DUF4277 domain-containing protein [Petroclostridium sp. X23]|uniref:DUF4277 domain-containing protein n=1 Tax=Petroclostridium sp. X23 TaxID=3045146 RepID=UPI0024AD4348|nr:DUF4277 domain-containing protein [Petroclostridium sp. X23]WHH59709.1 DUF4277 domain-containing protein [Petroclostridium sp. X23]WHH60122.1 DUF4277 domain-containing protein [Petroclostridium sp. X23]
MAKASKKSHKHKRNKKRKITILHPAKVEQPLILPFALLLANKFLKLIGFVEFIDGSVEWDESHWKVSPGNLAKAVILATFMQVRAPLYRIKRAFAGYDTEALFGKGVMPEHLNDYSIARALERINALVMLMNISLLIRAIVQYKIRKSINESEEELPRIGWNNKKLENPTIKYVLEALEKAYFVKEQEDTYSYGFYSEHQQLTVTTVLELLDIDIEEFLE